MRRSADFGATVRYGRRAVQPDAIVYSRVVNDRPTDESGVSVVVDDAAPFPQIGLIIAKSVGSAVVRHRVARRLRHVAHGLLSDLKPHERIVIRALPSSDGATSEALGNQLHAGLRSIRRATSAVS